MTGGPSNNRERDPTRVPPNWRLENPHSGTQPETFSEVVRLLQKDLMDRVFSATDDACNVHVMWGGLSQQWLVISTRDGRQGPECRFEKSEYSNAVKEALDRMWVHHDTGNLPD